MIACSVVWAEFMRVARRTRSACSAVRTLRVTRMGTMSTDGSAGAGTATGPVLRDAGGAVIDPTLTEKGSRAASVDPPRERMLASDRDEREEGHVHRSAPRPRGGPPRSGHGTVRVPGG